MKDSTAKAKKTPHKLTVAQQRCYDKLMQVRKDCGWVLNHGDNIGFQRRVLEALVAMGLVQRYQNEYRAVDWEPPQEEQLALDV